MHFSDNCGAFFFEWSNFFGEKAVAARGFDEAGREAVKAGE